MEKRTGGVLETAVTWVVNDFTMKKRIILSGMGWGRMPRHLVEDEIRNGELVVLTSKDFTPFVVDARMIRKKNKPAGPVATKLWTLLQELGKSASL